MTNGQRSIFAIFALAGMLGGCECGGGGVTVGDRPDAPVLDPYESSLLKCISDGCVDKVQLSGLKQSSTGIENNGVTAVALNERTDFSFEVVLVEGDNRFKLEAVDNAGSRSSPVIVDIALVRRPDAPVVSACLDGLEDGECRRPDDSLLLIHAEESIDWAGTRPEGAGVRMVQTVDGVVERDELVVSPGPGTDWSISEVALKETEDGFTNINSFEFFSYESDTVQSAPTTIQVDYDTSGCTLRFEEHQVADGDAFSEVVGCLITVDGEDRPGFCAWTSKTLEDEQENGSILKRGAYDLEGRSCEGSAVMLTTDGGDPVEIKEESAEVSWSHSVERPWADPDTPNEGEHILAVWAALENGRTSTTQYAKVVFDFSAPAVGEISIRSEEGDVIEGSNTNSSRVQVCGETEGGAEIQISNTDAEGEAIGTCEGSAGEDGTYCVPCELAEGLNQLYVTVVDRARNSSVMHEDEASRGRSRLLNVDSVGPAVTFISPQANAWVDPGEIEVRVRALDLSNGVASVVGGVGEGDTVDFNELAIPGESDVYGGTLTIPAEGDRYVVYVVATDNVGNESRTTVNLSRTGASVQMTAEEGALNSIMARIAVGPSGHMYAVWQHCEEFDTCSDTRIYAATVTDEGNWGTPAVITYLTGAAPEQGIDGLRTAASMQPDVAVDAEGVAHVVWSDAGTGREGVAGEAVWSGPMRSGVRDIVYRTWDGSDGAEGLSTVEVVSVGDELGLADMENPRIAVGSDGQPAVVFGGGPFEGAREFEAFYSARAAGGWSAVKVSDHGLNSSDLDLGAGQAAIVIDHRGNDEGGDGHHVVWVDDGDIDGDGTPDSDVYYSLIGEEGIRIVNGNCEGGASEPAVAVDMTDANYRVYVAYRASGNCADPAAAAEGVDGRSIRFAWHEGQAAEFTTPVTVNDEAVFVEEEVRKNGSPTIAVYAPPPQGEPGGRPISEHVVVVGFQTKAPLQSSGTDYDVVLRRFDRDDAPLAQGFVVISEPTVDEDNDTTTSREPMLALDASGAAHVVWQQLDDGQAADFDIFYAVSAP